MGAEAREPAGRCGWCGGDLDPGDRVGERRVRCRRCGADTTIPVPSSEELDDAYETWYRPRGGRFSGPGDWLLRRTRSSLAARLERIAPAGPVLDIGAGDGWLVDSIEARGRHAVGTERADLPAGPGAHDEPWAAIVLWHSLEHLPDAGEQLAGLPAHLAPRGMIVIAMPNRSSLQARAFGDRWLHLDLPRHLVHVPAASLEQRLRGCGMRIERVSFLRGGQVTFGWLHGLVALLPGSPDLYAAVRRAPARSRPVSPAARAATLLAGAALLPVALALTIVEVAARRGGTVYVEARLA